MEENISRTGVWCSLLRREYSATPCHIWRREELFDYFYTRFTLDRPKHFYYDPLLSSTGDAVFNLKFNEQGVLVAVCASGGVVVLDPRVRGAIARKPNAHEDCANVVCFMDNVRFFTGSDDCSVKLWDLRNMSNCLNTFKGHTNWVKNLEYDSRVDLLYSSAFDDTVRVWDICNMSKPSSILVVKASLFRMCVSPKRDALVLTTRSNSIFSLLPGRWYDNVMQGLESHSSVLGAREHCRSKQLKLVQKYTQHWLKGGGLVQSIDVDVDRRPLFLPSDLPSTSPVLHRFALVPPSQFENVYSVCFNNTGDCLALRGTARDPLHLGVRQDILVTFDYKGIESVPEEWASRKRILAQFVITRQEAGIIKEIVYDSTGCYIASPCGKDVVLFSGVTGEKKIIGRCGGCTSHGLVLTCQFSPVEPLVASGNMDGHVGFHYPHL